MGLVNLPSLWVERKKGEALRWSQINLDVNFKMCYWKNKKKLGEY